MPVGEAGPDEDRYEDVDDRGGEADDDGAGVQARHPEHAQDRAGDQDDAGPQQAALLAEPAPHHRGERCEQAHAQRREQAQHGHRGGAEVGDGGQWPDLPERDPGVQAQQHEADDE
ncbi:hypothetical protein GCM10010430_73140 [Kitasatospora cystarginea]|uniref:Uncharacterized protein n=1 Tax=Kitasatospora cystarginea TaxID=58350 RepID=A0ABN3EXU5_9ACTN